MITVVGLGRDKGDITARGKKAIASADRIVCRTLLSNASRAYKNRAESFDELYENSKDFDELNETIATKLVEMAKTCQNLVYLVDGDGYGDATVRALGNKTDIAIIGGVSATPARQASGGILSVPATELVVSRPLIDTNFALEITDIDNALLAGEVKLFLSQFYADTTKLTFSCGKTKEEIELHQLDRLKKYDYSASAYFAPLEPFNKQKYCFADVLRVIERLTAPDGCEWDKAQTHSSIRINMIEEAYEAVEAIINDDLDNMAEEFGDVLLQAVLHSDISRRSGEFDFSDVVNGLCQKLITRHTHIFGENKADSAEAALGFWEQAKAKEKKYRSLDDILSSVPESFPALLYCEKIVKKVSKAGYDILAQDIKTQLRTAIDNKEIGKMLFLCVVLAAAEKSDAEVELFQVCSALVKKCKEGLPESSVKISDIL